MPKLCKFFPVLAVLAVLTLFAIPNTAHAALATVDCSAGGDVMSAFQNNLTKAAQDQAAASHNVFTGVPDIDVRANYCLDTISSMFDLNASLADPLGIIGNLVRQQILSLVDQACAAAISATSQITQFGLSQFNRLCVPIPSLSLGIGLDLGLHGPTCNGTNLLGVRTYQGTAPPQTGAWQIWGQQ